MAENDLISKCALLRHLDMAIDCKDCPRNINKDLYTCNMRTTSEGCTCSEVSQICCRITNFVSDVQPVKHGYWIKQPEKFQIHEDVINSNYLYSCSCCNASDLHSERANDDGEVKFCWRCGARMDGDKE